HYTGATVTPVNGHVFGAYVNASDHTLGALAQLRLSFYPRLDFGFHGGLSRLDPGGTFSSRTTLRVGTDLRYQLTSLSGAFPADLAIGASLGVEAADQFKVITVGPSAVLSRAVRDSSSGSRFVPYVGAALNFSSRDA